MMPAVTILKAVIDPRGRADRRGFLITMTVGGMFAQATMLFAPSGGTGSLAFAAVALWLCAVPCQRRLHDLGMSGWLVFAVLPLLFIWSVVASLIVGAAAFAMGGATLAMLETGGPLHLALAAMIGLPLIVVGGWLSFARGSATANGYGPAPGAFGLSEGHDHAAPVPVRIAARRDGAAA